MGFISLCNVGVVVETIFLCWQVSHCASCPVWAVDEEVEMGSMMFSGFCSMGTSSRDGIPMLTGLVLCLCLLCAGCRSRGGVFYVDGFHIAVFSQKNMHWPQNASLGKYKIPSGQ